MRKMTMRLLAALAAVLPLVSEGADLRISEIMPKPWGDIQANRGTLEGLDPNGLASGWVELENTSTHEVDLADYRFVRVNRGKKLDTTSIGNFPSWKIPAGGRTIFYTSERYANSVDRSVSAFATPVNAGQPMVYTAKTGEKMLIWPDKVSPKKFPFVRLYYAPGGVIRDVVDTVVIPSDIPDGASVVVGASENGKATKRWISLAPTKNAANPSTAGLTALGPNVGPLYEVEGGGKTGVASEFDLPVPPAKPGADYAITFAANPVMNPDGTLIPRAEDTFTKIELVYRSDLTNATLKTKTVDLATRTVDAQAWGDQYTVTIPKADLPAAGHLVQWKFKLTDKAGNVWTSPSHNNQDDGYEWYGTIVEPTADQLSPRLATWHLFIESWMADTPGRRNDNCYMNINTELVNEFPDRYPDYPKHGVRIAIYDSSTSNYYDYVQIDQRGHSTSSMAKKSHSLAFAKTHPVVTRDAVTGAMIEGVRKTSLIGEYADPTYLRQLSSFWLMNRNGAPCPFHYPVRLNLNGVFYQLAFHSERFSDELVGSCYGLDEYGYAFKATGPFSGHSYGGEIEMKAPSGEGQDKFARYHGITTPFDTFIKTLPTAEVTSAADHAKFTKLAREKLDLPAWFNYLALTRITHECDDSGSNLCGYLDDPTLLEGTRGTGLWRPLGYDQQMSFGQYYNERLPTGEVADYDWLMSHPFVGGFTVSAWKTADRTALKTHQNRVYETIYQNEKFRRLYLRRLRTLMDAELGAPDSTGTETWRNTTVPVFQKMREVAALMADDAAKDRALWKFPNNCSIDVWTGGKEPKSVEAGLDSIWANYVVPRRQHLFVTHSVDNAAKTIGYGTDSNAGIPRRQSPLADLKAKLSVVTVPGGAVIRNLNAETIDISGWKLSGAVKYKLPCGTVIDCAVGTTPGEVFIVTDRRAYVASNAATLTDELILGNAEVGKGEFYTLATADDETIFTDVPETVNTFALEGDGAWGKTANWTHATVPNGVGAEGFIGNPSTADRTVTVEDTVTVGKVSFENGDAINRLAVTGGDFILNGNGVDAHLNVEDTNTVGVTYVTIGAGRTLRLETDAEVKVRNTIGNPSVGGLVLEGAIAGNGFNLKKTGEGRLTMRLTNAANETAPIAKLQADTGILAIETPFTVTSVTKGGPVWLAVNQTSLESAATGALVCMDKLSADRAGLFVPAAKGTFYGGVVAASIKNTNGQTVYVPDAEGEVSFNGSTWRAVESATVAIVPMADGRKTYSVTVTTGDDPTPPGHVHAYGLWTVTKAATCTAAGVETRTCVAAGCTTPPSFETRTIAALGHAWGAWVVTKEPQVGVKGEETRTCTRTGCGATETRDIDPLPDPGPVNPGEPVATEYGYYVDLKGGTATERVCVYTNTTKGFTFAVPEGVTSLRYLVIGGGAGGGGAFGGGGGAGGFLTGTLSSDLATTYAITVGVGGAGAVGNTSVGGNGGDSSLGAIVALGGGGGATYNVSVTASAGGSGGGGSAGKGTLAYKAGAGTEGQGFAGGNGVAGSVAGGGGGAGGPGVAGVTTPAKKSGDGGDGKTSDITGVTCEYAGGGGGCGDAAAYKLTAGSGAFGGGDGGVEYGSGGDATTPGSGGGGAARISPYSTASGRGGNGADGIVIVRYTLPGGDPEPEAKPTVDGKSVDPAKVFEVATSTKPITYPSAPTVSGTLGHQTIAFGGTTVSVPEYYTATQSGNTVSLALNGNAIPTIADGKDGTKAFVVTEKALAIHLEHTYEALFYALSTAKTLADPWTTGAFAKGRADFTLERDTSAASCFCRIVVGDHE